MEYFIMTEEDLFMNYGSYGLILTDKCLNCETKINETDLKLNTCPVCGYDILYACELAEELKNYTEVIEFETGNIIKEKDMLVKTDEVKYKVLNF